MKTLKIFLYVFSICLLIAGLSNSVQASTLSDDFNDGNANGWLFDGGGNWGVSDGLLFLDYPHDGDMLRLNNFPMSTQSIEAKTLYNDGGIVVFYFWFQDHGNWVSVGYPYQGGVFVSEDIGYNGNFLTIYPVDFPQRIWRTLKVNADSDAGIVTVYLDNTLICNHKVTTTNRSGLTGLGGLWTGAEFDDFRVTSNDLPFKIDIEPGVYPNTIKLNTGGKVAVAILSSQNFDASTQINPTTVSFAGAPVTSKGKNVLIEDVNGDGLPDMVLEFDTQSLQLNSNSTVATLTGKTFDGMTITMTDAVQILSKGKTLSNNLKDRLD